MSLHDDRSRLRHMLNHAIEAVQMAAGRTREDLNQDLPSLIASLKTILSAEPRN